MDEKKSPHFINILDIVTYTSDSVLFTHLRFETQHEKQVQNMEIRHILIYTAPIFYEIRIKMLSTNSPSPVDTIQ